MKEKKELIQQIVERLHSHEEHYEEGAWERFVDYQKQKRKISPFYWVAAASVLLLFGAGVFFYLNGNKSAAPQPIVVKNEQNTLPKKSNSSDTAYAKTNVQDIIQSINNSVNSSDINNDQHNNYANNKNNLSVINFNNQINSNTTQSTNGFTNTDNFYSNILRQQYYAPDTTKKITNQVAVNNNLQQSNQAINNTATPNQRNPDSGKLTYFPQDASDLNLDDNNTGKSNNVDFRRWTAEAVLSPSMSNNSNKVNMGYGVAVGYNVSKKVSVNSGASYLQLTGYSDNSASSNSNIQANVTGISVPVEIRYQVSKKIYVNAGASALAVLSNKQQVNFIAANIQSDAFALTNGISVNKSTTLDKPIPKVNAAATQESKVNGQNVAGFFNFSIGMKQKIGTNTNMSIEPFVSVPVNGNFGKQNVHLTNAGVRIKFGL